MRLTQYHKPRWIVQDQRYNCLVILETTTLDYIRTYYPDAHWVHFTHHGSQTTYVKNNQWWELHAIK